MLDGLNAVLDAGGQHSWFQQRFVIGLLAARVKLLPSSSEPDKSTTLCFKEYPIVKNRLRMD